MDGSTHFVAEAYDATDAAGTAAKLQQAARELAREGEQVRHLLSLLARQEQLCLHLFTASSRSLVGEVGRRAGVRFDRVWPAVYHPQQDDDAARLTPAAPESTRKEQQHAQPL